MRKLVRKYHDLISDPGFLRFQHERISAVYDQLGQGYREKEGEVALVTRMAETLKGNSYKGLRIHCEKIHGSKSYVSFDFRAKPTTKELGDLILISVVTSGRTRILQKLCIVQNKVLRNGKSSIDMEQLFLLKNFPLFSGSQGLFRGSNDVMFRNSQGCLGAYGFFEEPGELVHVNAGVMSNALGGTKYFSKDKLGGESSAGDRSGFNHNSFDLQWADHHFVDEMIYYYVRRGFPLPFGSPMQPLTSSRRTLHDLHDFIKSWTSLQVGELVYALDRVIDVEADRFSTTVLRAIGLGEFIDFDGDEFTGELNAGTTVMVSHFDLEHE